VVILYLYGNLIGDSTVIAVLYSITIDLKSLSRVWLRSQSTYAFYYMLLYEGLRAFLNQLLYFVLRYSALPKFSKVFHFNL
jgi:hypothetical protein